MQLSGFLAHLLRYSCSGLHLRLLATARKMFAMLILTYLKKSSACSSVKAGRTAQQKLQQPRSKRGLGLHMSCQSKQAG